MAVAAGASNLRTPHTQGPVLVFGNGKGLNRTREGRPAAAGLELFARRKERIATGAAYVCTRVLRAYETSFERRLRAMLT